MIRPLTSHERQVRDRVQRELYGESGYHRIARLARPWRWYASDLPTLALIGALLAFVLVLLTGCVPSSHVPAAELADADAPTAPYDAETPAVDAEGECAALEDAVPVDAAPIAACFVQSDMGLVFPGKNPLTQLRGAACAGRWVTSHLDPVPMSGPTTRDEPWWAHPLTMLCTFRCADACFTQYCTELGGHCGSDGSCVANP